VRDEGIGIDAGSSTRSSSLPRAVCQGSGLGLAIVHRIVSDYNGEIQVSSQPAPARPCRCACPRARRWFMSTALQPVAPETDRRPPRILVVDDERSMRELLAIVLRREGTGAAGENGRAASICSSASRSTS